MKVIGTFSQQLMQEKEKEVKALNQVVESKSKIVSEKDELTKLHQNLLEQLNKADAESKQIESQNKELNKLKEQMKNSSDNSQLGQLNM